MEGNLLKESVNPGTRQDFYTLICSGFTFLYLALYFRLAAVLLYQWVSDG